MNVKKIIAIATVAIVAFGTAMDASAQQKREQGKKGERKQMTPEQMLERKTARLANELALDDAKTADFTKLYKQYNDEMTAVMKKYQPERFQKPDTTARREHKVKTDAEVEKQILDRFAMSKATLDIREKYYKKFRTILSPKQIAKIYESEQGDRGRMQKERDRRAQGRAGFQPNGRQGAKTQTR